MDTNYVSGLYTRLAEIHKSGSSYFNQRFHDEVKEMDLAALVSTIRNAVDAASELEEVAHGVALAEFRDIADQCWCELHERYLDDEMRQRAIADPVPGGHPSTWLTHRKGKLSAYEESQIIAARERDAKK